MKRSNAGGNNEITSSIIKESPHFLSICICHLVNCIMRQGIFPDCFKVSRVIPILKKGKPIEEMDSYRPINNLNPLEKIVEEVIKLQMETNIKDKTSYQKSFTGAGLVTIPSQQR